jgi:hypothetical protein
VITAVQARKKTCSYTLILNYIHCQRSAADSGIDGTLMLKGRENDAGNNHIHRKENAKIRNMPNVKGNRIMKRNV